MKDKDLVENKFKVAQDSLLLQSSDLSLDTISSMVTKNAIDVTPHYQRRERWKPDRQSALIESFLLNVPVPPVYLAEDDFGTYSVIDGKQRITAIHQFMTGQLALRELASFSEIEGATFNTLPRTMRNALEIRPYLRVVTLLKQSSPDLKYEVFTRLNKGGESLNAQEIRNVAFRGPLNELIFTLSAHHFLRKQLKIKNDKTPAYRKMQDAEYVLRYFTLRRVWHRFSGSLNRSMDDFMKEHQNAGATLIKQLRTEFETAIATCERVWGDRAFQRPSGDGWRNQMLAGMFDAQMLAVSELSHSQRKEAIDHRKEIVDATIHLFTSDPEFDNAVRQGTNTPSRIAYRVEAVLTMLRSV